jgi:hypothetical protein
VQRRVRQVVCATEDMADLVVQARSRGRERGPGEVGADLEPGAHVEVVGMGVQPWQRVSQDADALDGHQRRHGVGAIAVERFGAMRERVHP